MIGRRTFLAGTGAVLLAAPRTAEGQPQRTWRIGWLAAGVRLPQSLAQYEVFREELRQRGYVPGQNILYEDRWAEGHFDRLPDLATELVRWNADLIVAAGGTPAALAAKKVTTNVPIVVVSATLPVETSLVASLARPGGNVTGVTFDAGSGETSKRLQLFREVLPRGASVVGIVNLAFPGMTIYWNEALQVAKQLGMEMDTVDTRSSNADIVGIIGQRRVGGLYIVLDQVVAAQGRRIIEVATERRWPTMFAGTVGKGFVEAGGLMAYSPSQDELFRKAAVYVDKILKGAKPGDLPMEQPTRFEFVINIKTAKALGLTIPPLLLLQADQVIQ